MSKMYKEMLKNVRNVQISNREQLQNVQVSIEQQKCAPAQWKCPCFQYIDFKPQTLRRYENLCPPKIWAAKELFASACMAIGQ